VQIPWNLNKPATCPLIEQFLTDCFWNDAEMVEFLFAVAGYLMLSRNSLRLAWLMFGHTGHNGKSIFLHLCECLLGARNTAAVPLQRLGGEDRFAPAELKGKLANICGDIGPNTAKDMSLFKQLTGGDPIHAEHKFGQPFKFRSGATPIFSANEFPGSPDTTKAYKGRWIAVPWTREFAEDAEKEAELKSLGQDADEMEGMAVRSLRSVSRMIETGSFESFMPQAVRDCTARFQQAIDPFESFAEERLQLRVDSEAHGPYLYVAYQEFCKANGYKHTLGRNRFYDKLEGLPGVWRATTSAARPFMGVSLTTEAEFAAVEA
jgi:putative DNA primase/helicase